MCPIPDEARSCLTASLGPASFIVFSELDGTLLDAKTYRFDAARPTLELLRTRGIPLVLCSSKTRREMKSAANALATAIPSSLKAVEGRRS